MKVVARTALKPGMEIGEDVYSNSGTLVFSANTVLDRMSINKLTTFSIMCVPIKEPIDYATTYYEKLRLTKNFKQFEAVYRDNLESYKYMFSSFLDTGMPINLTYLLQIHQKIIFCATTPENLLDMLYILLPSEDDITYAHCLNTSLISTVFGGWLKLPREELTLLTLCGFFYDIGKLKLPASLLWKSEKLTDFEYNWIKTHTKIGYDLIKNQRLNQHILNATLMHHERCDGSGYPNHYREKDIDIYAQYMAIVDSYEAMTSARTYRKSLNPFEVIQAFECTGVEKYGQPHIGIFLSHIAHQHEGRTVLLSNDVRGDIVSINKHALSTPVVKVGEEIFDLSEYPDMKILAIL